mmetsp:Transcript_34156/g.82587  ORF Transcript_34156/g.82587 Transcript_34156/m.82587 type:complete len:278 (-) Transcript_34156:695-1528(-)
MRRSSSRRSPPGDTLHPTLHLTLHVIPRKAMRKAFRRSSRRRLQLQEVILPTAPGATLGTINRCRRHNQEGILLTALGGILGTINRCRHRKHREDIPPPTLAASRLRARPVTRLITIPRNNKCRRRRSIPRRTPPPLRDRCMPAPWSRRCSLRQCREGIPRRTPAPWSRRSTRHRPCREGIRRRRQRRRGIIAMTPLRRPHGIRSHLLRRNTLNIINLTRACILSRVSSSSSTIRCSITLHIRDKRLLLLLLITMINCSSFLIRNRACNSIIRILVP